MSGRERPRKARSPDSRPKEMKHTSPVQRTGCKEEKQEKIKRNKKPDPQKPNHAEEKPAVEQTTKEKPIKRLTRERSKEQQMPAESTKAKTCSTRSKSVKTPSGDQLNRQPGSQTATMQPETPKEFIKASLKATKASGKAESKTHCTEVPAKTEGAQPKKETEREVLKKTEPAAENSNDKVCPDKIKPKMLKAKANSQDSVLQSVLGKLKIGAKDRSDASKVVNNFIENLIKYLKTDTICFQDVEDPLRTGSYYENLKISDPDEFDVMIPMPVERVEIQPFGAKGAFYSVALKRGNNPLKKFQQDDILSASEMLKEFRKEVKTFAKGVSAWTMTKKKEGCPAVTLIQQVSSVIISLDVVLCLKVKSSWPSFTRDGLGIEQWLGTKVKQEYKRKPYYLVPKYEGRGNVENEGVLNKDVWRVSFSHIEKDIIKKHGSEKTCCERAGEKCCRKACLKLLKHLLHLLKESEPSFDKFCSYHAKTMLLHACCTRSKDSDWRESDLNHCFSLLLESFESQLRRSELYNFFIPSQNLLSDLGKNRCRKLADSIKEQRENGFPIFVTDLRKA